MPDFTASLHYQPTVLSLNALSTAYENVGFGPLNQLHTIDNTTLLQKASALSDTQRNDVAILQGRVLGLQRVRVDVEMAQTRLSHNTYHSFFNYLDAQGVTSQQFINKIARSKLGQDITTHPLQLETAEAEALLDEYSTKYHRYMDLTKGTKAGNEFGTTRHPRDPKILNEIKTLARDLTQLETQIATVPLYNTDAPSALAEARLKLKPMATQLDAWVENLVNFRRTAAQHYTDLNTINSPLFNHTPFYRTDWLIFDKDRNLKLLPEDSLNFKGEKAALQFQRHTTRLDGAITYFQNRNPAAADQLTHLKTKLANTAQRFGIEGYTLTQGAGAFADERDYELALRQIQNTIGFGTKNAWKLESLVAETQLGGFHFSMGEARHNADVVDTLIDALARRHGITNMLDHSAEHKLAFLNGAFKDAKKGKLDLTSLDLNFLNSSPTSKLELERFIQWAGTYKDMHSRFGKKTLVQVILANANCPSQIAAMRLALQSEGISSGLLGDVTVRPLLESHQDHISFYQRLSTMSRKWEHFVFPQGRKTMQATSDISWVDGLLYSFHRVTAFGMKIMRDTKNSLADKYYAAKEIVSDTGVSAFTRFKALGAVMRGKYDTIASIYQGTGVGPQRFGGRYSFQHIGSFPDGVEQMCHTLQGDQVHNENRNFRMAYANAREYGRTFFGRVFGFGNDPFHATGNAGILDIAQRNHRIYQEMISNNPAYDLVLSKFTPLPYEAWLNKGSRSGKGFPNVLNDTLVDVTAKLQTFDLRGALRAITKAISSSQAGFEATQFGFGLSTQSWINEAHKGNEAAGLAELKTCFANNPRFRHFVMISKKGNVTSDLSLTLTHFADKLSHAPDAGYILQNVQRDIELQRQYLWQIDPRPLERTNLNALRGMRAMLLTQLSAVRDHVKPTALLYRLVDGARKLTPAGSRLTTLFNTMSSVMRTIGHGG